MKLLLTAVNAKYIHSNLAVYNLQAYARTYSKSPQTPEIEIAEYTINHRSEQILQDIYKKNPDVLFFSCYIWNYSSIRETAAEYHKLRPDIPIWVGGPEVSYEIEQTLSENPAFFGIMSGEGEKAFTELADYYCSGIGELSEISGIAYRGFKQKDRVSGAALRKRNTDIPIYQNPPGMPIDLSQLPFCYEDMEQFKNRIIYYESSRGCPFSCSYCLSSIDKRLRFRDIRLVKDELAFFIEKEVPQVKFVDRTFNCSHTHAMAVWKQIKELDRGITNFHFEIAADLLNEEELEFLSTLRPGLIQLEIGVQSTNPGTIEEIHRNMDLSKVASAVKRIQKAGNIHIHLDLIAGLPQESYDQFAQSFRDIYALKPEQLQLGFLKVLKGSYLYEHREEYGMVYQNSPPYEIRKTRWISYDEILKIKLVEEMLEVYYNSGQFEVTMKLLDAVYSDSFALFLVLGQFYEQKGYRFQNHSRIRRSELLLEFIVEDGRMPKELAEESLLYDLYYRENMKSRPDWAKSPAEFSRITKIFCKNGTLSHIEPFSYRFPKKDEKTIAKLPERRSEPIYVLFEYNKRDALTHQAKTTEINSLPDD